MYRVNFRKGYLGITNYYFFHTCIPLNAWSRYSAETPEILILKTNLMQPAFQFKSKGYNFQTKPNQVFKQQLQGMLFFPESCFVVLMKTFNIFLKYKMYWKESQSKLQLTGLVIKYFSQCLIRI